MFWLDYLVYLESAGFRRATVNRDAAGLRDLATSQHLGVYSRQSYPQTSKRIAGWTLRSRALAIGAAVVLAVFGLAKMRDAPMNPLPEFSPPTVVIQIDVSLLASVCNVLAIVASEQIASRNRT